MNPTIHIATHGPRRNAHHRSRGRARNPIGVLALLCAVTAWTADNALAALFNWSAQPGAVIYPQTINWSPAGIPGPADTARFGVAQTNIIGFPLSTAVGTLRVLNGDHTFFPIGGNTSYAILADSRVDGGNLTLAGSGSLTFLMNVNAANWEVGGNGGPGSPSTLTIEPGATFLQQSTGTFTLYAPGTLELGGGALTTGSFDNSAGGVFSFNDGVLTIDSGVFDPGADDYTLDGAGPADNPTLILSGGAAAPNLTTQMRIGDANQGTLQILDGSSINLGNWLYIGYDADAAGHVTVAGPGSTLDAGLFGLTNIEVGYYGEGTLDVANGATVTAHDDLYMGTYAGAAGTLTVDDAPLVIGDQFWVGVQGTGVAAVNSGGTITVGGDVELAESDAASSGTLTVDDAGSAVTIAGLLRVGDRGAAEMTISAGGSVSTIGNSIIGGNTATSFGTVTVTGVGSEWVSASEMRIGNRGDAVLSVEDGGLVQNTGYGYISRGNDSESAATVTGAGSAWNNQASLFLGGSDTADAEPGFGTLTVRDGGTVTVADTLKIWDAASGVTLTGLDPTLTVATFDNSAGGVIQLDDGVLTIDGGEFNPGTTDLVIDGPTAADNPAITLANGAAAPNLTGSITVGDLQQGALQILSGSSLPQNSSLSIGEEAGANGAVTVAGPGSSWEFGTGSPSDCYVGKLGTGLLTVADGAVVDVSGGAQLGAEVGATGDAVIADATLSVGGTLRVGVGGTGTLTATDAGSVTADYLWMAVDSGSTGSATFNNSTIEVTSDFVVGYYGDGILELTNGASATAGGLLAVGYLSNAHGSLVVDNATLAAASVVGVGTYSTGVITVTGGATFTAADDVILGNTSGGVGTLNIDGASSCGFAADLNIGHGPGSAGTVTLDGAELSLSGGMYVGGQGEGTFELTNGATFTGAAWANIGAAASVPGMLSIDDSAFELASTLDIHQQGSVYFSGGRLRADTIRNSAGGRLDMSGGTLIANRFVGDLHQKGGTLAPGGDEAGITDFDDHYFNSNGALQIDILGAGGDSPIAGVDYDHIDATEVTLADTLIINTAPGYSPLPGDSFEIVSATTAINGSFDIVSGADLGGGLEWQVQYNGAPVVTSVSLTVVNVGGVPGDCDFDGDLDYLDVAAQGACMTGPGGVAAPSCGCADTDSDGDVDLADFQYVQTAFQMLCRCRPE